MSDAPQTPAELPSEALQPDAPQGEISHSDAPQKEWRNFYGRIKGHTIRGAQKTYISEDLSTLTPKGISQAENPERLPVDPQAIFGNDNPIWLEVGFGGGEHLVHMCARYPQVNIIGCEPYINGVAMLLGKIRRAKISNIAVYPFDARDLMEVFPAGSIAKAFLNYPDPWPKRRHHRRRFVTQDHLQPLARLMPAGAEFRVATDIPSYMDQALREVPRAGYALAHHDGVAWGDWLSTRYEQKALREGRVPDYATFTRL